MPTRLNKASYTKLIEENIAWLRKQPETLERAHIIQVLRASIEFEYERPTLGELSRRGVRLNDFEMLPGRWTQASQRPLIALTEGDADGDNNFRVYAVFGPPENS